MAYACEGKSVLIVDDDPDILEAIRIAFEDAGATTETASDGNKAVELATSLAPDLVILDQMLPKRSGLLVLEKLKSPKNGTKPYIIMITGNQGNRHKTWAESLGVDDYLNKPFGIEMLMEKVEKVFSN